MEKNVTVGTAAVLLLEYAVDRTSYNIQNKGTVTVYLGYNRDVGATGAMQGRALAAGAIESADSIQDPDLIVLDQYAISGTAGQVVRVEEFRRMRPR